LRLTKSLERMRARHLVCQFVSRGPPASLSSAVRHDTLVILLICMGAMLACFLVGEIASLPAHAGGRVSVAFLGLTNDAFGAKVALFQFTNGLSRDIGFSAGPIEVKSSEGWPQWVQPYRVRANASRPRV
jgi:hypothetical protein